MAIILEAAVAEDEDRQQPIAKRGLSTIPDLLAALQPPAWLPPPQDDRNLVSQDGIDVWRAAFEQAVDELTLLSGQQPKLWSSREHDEALVFALSRWLPAEAAEDQEGWILDRRVRTKLSALLNQLPPPDLLSLKPIFQSTPPPQLSTTSFRALPKPIHNDDVALIPELWRSTAGWGCWNVLRLAVDGLDETAPVPIPVLLPPLLALLDSTHAPTRCRGLHVLRTVIDKTTAASTRTGTSRGWGGERGKWLNQTGLGEVLMKSLSTLLQLPNSTDDPLPSLHLTSVRTYLSLAILLYAPNSVERSRAIDELIYKGMVLVYTYRQGGELGSEAREIASWLATGSLWSALGSIGTVRHLGPLLSSLLVPMGELTYTSRRSRAFGIDLLRAIDCMLVIASVEGVSRVAQWRGAVLNGVGRMWVGVREAEVLPEVGQAGADDFAELKQLIGQLLRTVRNCSPEFEVQVRELAELDQSAFGGLLVLLA